MDNIYELSIDTLEVKKVENDLQDVVFIVNFSYSAVTQDRAYGEVITTMASIPSPNPESFIPFENLSLEQVEGWVEAAVDLSKFREVLDARIEEKINPPTELKKAPWVIIEENT